MAVDVEVAEGEDADLLRTYCEPPAPPPAVLVARVLTKVRGRQPQSCPPPHPPLRRRHLH